MKSNRGQKLPDLERQFHKEDKKKLICRRKTTEKGNSND